MRKFLAILGIVLASSLPTASQASAALEPGAAESAFVQLANAERARAGLAPLQVDGGLATIARAWSGQMAASGKLAHNPSFAAQISANVTPKWSRVGENVGHGTTPDRLHAAFMASQAHRDNVLGTFNRVGVGVVIGSDGSTWVTFNFMQGPDLVVASVPAVAVAQAGSGANGYWVTTSNGGLSARCGADLLGSLDAVQLARPIVGMASTPTGRGYWLVASDGGIFAFGDAKFYGSTGAMRLAQPVVGMASTPTGRGYWLVASDGGIFSFGDAAFYGSTGAMRLAQPVVGMASSPTGRGYWLVASDGGIFAFGDANFHGSTGAIRLARPVTAMLATESGAGYWFVASDGGIFAFGDAKFYGSTADMRLSEAVVGMATTANANGYRVVTAKGAAHAFGDAASASSSC